MTISLIPTTGFTEIVAFLANAVLLGAVVASGGATAPGIAGAGWLLVAAAAGCLGAAACAVVPLFGEPAVLTARLAEPLRLAGWTLALLSLLWRVRGRCGLVRHHHPLVLGVGALTVVPLAVLLASHLGVDPARAVAAVKPEVMARLILDVVALMIADNVFRQSSEAMQWACKHLLIGIGGILCYDLFVSAQALMLPSVEPMLSAARPLVDGLAVPLMVVSLARLKHQAPTPDRLGRSAAASPALIVHSTMLLGSGLYLSCVAVFGYLLRETGLPSGPALQVALLVGALLLMVTLLASRQARLWVRLVISRNYLPLMHDYRREWLRFIATMSASSSDRDDLHDRVIRAVADIFECTSGALFLRGPDDVFTLRDGWNWPSTASITSLPDAVAARLLTTGKTVELAGQAAGPEDEQRLATRAELWLVVPLAVGKTVLGAVLLGRPRVPRRLTWEDEELLVVLSVQLGSYIAEQQATQALVEARRFERVSKGVTFIAHDLKNLVSQLHLIIRQADLHADDPDFRRDLIATVQHSVEKMRLMLQRLNDHRAEEQRGEGQQVEPVDLAALVRGTIDLKQRLFPTVTITGLEAGLRVAVEPLAFSAVLENLLQNAFEAAGPAVPVRISCLRDGDRARLEIRDAGPGMAEAFVRTRLATPFHPGKPGGYGLGLYQSRDLVEQAGGHFTVDSRPGAGTTIQIDLPLAPQPCALLSASLPSLASTSREASNGQHLRPDPRRTGSAADRR